ncbi:chondroitinase-B domain-containing protein [Magnetospira sp. QH-2]|uniref:chondroitinase-B domain-containing protein n=1 Tax=Magnetospira sp. (strain QH-2) TaxID=1288970 RepID=UPI0003E81A46|nr:chondroitinase-B domain-containing protein [Magnetospira sp. QH-2]CCQ72978.1 conserved exported protein of unknown function [Magnetospira sp. QH-2]
MPKRLTQSRFFSPLLLLLMVAVAPLASQGLGLTHPAKAGQQITSWLDWSGVGASRKRLSILPYAHEDRSKSQKVAVASVKELKKAIRKAKAGQTIIIAPGTYRVPGSKIPAQATGRADAPITVMANTLGDVILEFDLSGGFNVKQPYWNFENLVIRGVCAKHTKCEHAFHVVADARFIGIRNNIVIDFNAQVKVNGATFKKVRSIPDNGVIEGNTFINTAPRQTHRSVTPIDIVGAKDWIIRRNLIADYSKALGNKTSYAAFAKGESSGTLFENNLIICAMNQPPAANQVGLSFGGGGTGKTLCRNGACRDIEHTGGTMRGNVILNCSDVGIYLNKAADTTIHNNTILHTTGIDSRFAASSATIFNNILDGRIKERNGGSFTEESNLALGSKALFGLAGGAGTSTLFTNAQKVDLSLKDRSAVVGKGQPIPTPSADICGHKRDSKTPDLGAIEYKGGACDPRNLSR